MEVSPKAKFFLLSAFLLVMVLITCSGCQAKTFYPTIGAVVGGGAGALGGPIPAAVGAGAGAAVGQIAKGEEDIAEAREETRDVVRALTTGDVNDLVQKRLEEAKKGGFFDSMLKGIYDLMLIGAIVCGLWILIPIWYTRFVHKKVANG
jgi:hypothetical protein